MNLSIASLLAGALALGACGGDETTDTSSTSGTGAAGATSTSAASSGQAGAGGGAASGGGQGGNGGVGGQAGQGGSGGAALCDGVVCREGKVCCPDNATPESPHHCVPPFSSSEDCPKIP